MTSEELFLRNLGQTSPYPYKLEVEKAEGTWIYDRDGKKYLDLVAGVAVANLGYSNQVVKKAIKDQVDQYMHVMVYGEFIQESQNSFAENLVSITPAELNMVYPVNSGTEANEAALKLAKRVTGRPRVVAMQKSYHGATAGSLSITGNEQKKYHVRPLIPGTEFIRFNEEEDLSVIDSSVAAVVVETIQGDAGVRIPSLVYMEKLRSKCSEVGAKLIFDEVQVGMKRTGKWFAFEHFDVVPDYLVLGKALGGGMPIGALVAPREDMLKFTENPVLGHITTFGGHPVVMAGANACIEELKKISEQDIESKGRLFEELLSDIDGIVAVRRKGLMMAVELESAEMVQNLVSNCLERGVIIFFFLSTQEAFRVSPPLTITTDEIRWACEVFEQELSKLS